jgi:sporulation protein YlmC with PRC-barrel domain
MLARCMLCIAVVLFSPAAPGADEVRVISLPTLASEMIGTPVADASGNALGTVEDLVLDLEGKRARYAILAMDGRAIGVPIEKLDPSLHGERLILDAPPERLRDAPPLGGREGYWRAVEGYWRAPAPASLVRASELVGKPLQGERPGKVADILIDAHAGEVPFAIVEGTAEELHPVPLDALQPAAGGVLLAVHPQRGFTRKELDAGLHSSDFLRGNAAYADRLSAGSPRSPGWSLRR